MPKAFFKASSTFPRAALLAGAAVAVSSVLVACASPSTSQAGGGDFGDDRTARPDDRAARPDDRAACRPDVGTSRDCAKRHQTRQRAVLAGHRPVLGPGQRRGPGCVPVGVAGDDHRPQSGKRRRRQHVLPVELHQLLDEGLRDVRLPRRLVTSRRGAARASRSARLRCAAPRSRSWPCAWRRVARPPWLKVTVASNFPASACSPVTADWLRVYPPEETVAGYMSRRSARATPRARRCWPSSPWGRPGRRRDHAVTAARTSPL